MKVLHLLSSNKYSGAENVVCQIIKMFGNDAEMVYCSPDGDIRKTLNDKNIKFIPLKELVVCLIQKNYANLLALTTKLKAQNILLRMW